MPYVARPKHLLVPLEQRVENEGYRDNTDDPGHKHMPLLRVAWVGASAQPCTCRWGLGQVRRRMAVKNRKVAAKGGCVTYTERLYGDLLIVTSSERAGSS
jgi:hypothetical protein